MSHSHSEREHSEPHVVAEKVRFDEEGNVIEYTGETRYAGPADIELDVGDGPINGAEFLENLRDPDYYERISRRREAMTNPLHAFVTQAMETVSPDSPEGD